jgi:hypothetical protein
MPKLGNTDYVGWKDDYEGADSNEPIGSTYIADTLDDHLRVLRGNIKRLSQNLDWIRYDWVESYISSTSFKVGGNHTSSGGSAILIPNRRLRVLHASGSPAYGWVQSAVYNSGTNETTVVMGFSSGSISPDMTEVQVSVVSSESQAPGTPTVTEDHPLYVQDAGGPDAPPTYEGETNRKLGVIGKGQIIPATFTEANDAEPVTLSLNDEPARRVMVPRLFPPSRMGTVQYRELLTGDIGANILALLVKAKLGSEDIWHLINPASTVTQWDLLDQFVYDLNLVPANCGTGGYILLLKKILIQFYVTNPIVPNDPVLTYLYPLHGAGLFLLPKFITASWLSHLSTPVVQGSSPAINFTANPNELQIGNYSAGTNTNATAQVSVLAIQEFLG